MHALNWFGWFQTASGVPAMGRDFTPIVGVKTMVFDEWYYS